MNIFPEDDSNTHMNWEINARIQSLHRAYADGQRHKADMGDIPRPNFWTRLMWGLDGYMKGYYQSEEFEEEKKLEASRPPLFMSYGPGPDGSGSHM
jgi:hypothetical protein